jgi:glycosyltransferase involved in cell wall biosynthesis
VSSGLANIYRKYYEKEFLVLPNAERLSDNPRVDSQYCRSERTVIFLFQGGFSEARGIDLLIKNWSLAPKSAILYLRGPESSYKKVMVELADQLGLLNSKVFFPEPVSESQLVSQAKLADVGLIPYEPIGANHLNCCPNKLSQFMAAGLPILANNTSFVSEIIEKANCGIVTNFSDKDGFILEINKLTSGVMLREKYGSNGRMFFEKYFNWEALSQDFVVQLERLVRSNRVCNLEKFEFAYFEPKILRVPIFDSPGPISIPVSGYVGGKSFLKKVVIKLWRSLPDSVKVSLRVPATYLKKWI